MGLDGSGTTQIKWSDYRRKTGADEVFADVNATPDQKATATAIVPDAYENRTCGADGQGISSGTNHKVSSLRNMIKRYDVSYTGGSTSSQTISAGGAIPNTTTWDDNLDLNVPKRLTLDSSSWKASTTSEHALVFNGSALNLELKFNGTKVYGKEGAGGGRSQRGSSGGSALYLRNSTTKTNGAASTIKLNLTNSAFIAGGGGGGAGGTSGNTSGTTTCVTTTTVEENGSSNSWLRGCPGSPCPCNHGGGRYFRGHGGYSQGTIYWNDWRWTCSVTNNVTDNYDPPSVRLGGTGGAGAGSNRTSPQGGNSGQSAASTNCPAGAVQNATGTANAGNRGADGGGYGLAGGNSNGGQGGSAGKWLNASSTRWVHIGASSNTILKGGTQ
jgi:hypothetical protein